MRPQGGRERAIMQVAPGTITCACGDRLIPGDLFSKKTLQAWQRDHAGHGAERSAKHGTTHGAEHVTNTMWEVETSTTVEGEPK